MNNILYQNVKSLKLFLKIGLRSGSTSSSQTRIELNKSVMYLYEAYFEFAKYLSWTRDSLVKDIIELMKRDDFQETIKDIESKNDIIIIVKNIINNKNISNENKEKLIKAAKQINLINNMQI